MPSDTTVEEAREDILHALKEMNSPLLKGGVLNDYEILQSDSIIRQSPRSISWIHEQNLLGTLIFIISVFLFHTVARICGSDRISGDGMILHFHTFR